MKPKRGGSMKVQKHRKYRRSTEQTIYKNTEENSGKKTCSSTVCLKSKNGDIILEKEKKILD